MLFEPILFQMTMRNKVFLSQQKSLLLFQLLPKKKKQLNATVCSLFSVVLYSYSMANIEVQCSQFSELTVSLSKGMSDDDLARVKEQALDLVYTCDKRSLGGDCSQACSMPRIALANLDEIRKALEQATD